jgi:hypothetical protein
MNRMPLFLPRLLLAAPAAALISFACPAQDTKDAAAPPAVDPEVIRSLESMGAYLRTLKTFEVSTTAVTDELLDNGQMAQFVSNATIKVRRPDGLRLDTADDRGDRKQLFYNGRTTTVYGPARKYYATVPAPATLAEVAQVLAQKYGIELPLADLFYWGSDSLRTADIRSADSLGEAQVDGHATTHFAIREKDVDWQIWIDRGDKPLPRKLVITTTGQTARPQHATLLRWKQVPAFAAGTFDFRPPAGARRIALQTADGKVDETPRN